MPELDYWKECISIGAEELGPSMTDEQLTEIAKSVEGGHDNFGMAFYSPPSSERMDVIRREADDKLARLQAEFDAYRTNAETAVKKALRQYSDTQVSIHSDGEVLRHGGRTEKIQ
jgi:hypothetical protein